MECLRCQVPMREGYLLDRARTAFRSVQWVPGPSDVRYVAPPENRADLVAWRCPRCQAVELRARDIVVDQE